MLSSEENKCYVLSLNINLKNSAIQLMLILPLVRNYARKHNLGITEGRKPKPQLLLIQDQALLFVST